MAGCCEPKVFERMFGEKQARLAARRYRRRGLGGTSRDLVELAGDVSGASILEVGGGIGAIELELLAAGAARATDVELSGGYEEVAAEFLAERGVSDRVERRVGDFVSEPVEPHDVVVMHRVVCCYPDVDALVGIAAERARRRLVMTYPQERWWTRAGLGAINLFMRLSGSDFRAFVHPVARMRDVAGERGLVPTERRRRGLFWESAAFERLAAGAGGNSCAMEPRHQDLIAEEVESEREPSGAENELGPDEDDTGYDDELEDEAEG